MAQSKPDFMKGIYFPPQPGIIEEVRNASPNLNKIARIIAKDLSLSANIIRVVNSPLYSLKNKIGSIYQAVMLLGLDTVVNIINGLLIRGAFENCDTRGLEEFWNLNENIASTANFIGKRLSCAEPDDCYLLGLFHLCGLPAIMQRHTTYLDDLRHAHTQHNMDVESFLNNKFSTSHATVGYYIAQSWNLPKHIGLAIRDQLDTDNAATYNDQSILSLLATLKAASIICKWDTKLLGATYEHEQDYEFILTQLAISEYDFEDLAHETKEAVITR